MAVSDLVFRCWRYWAWLRCSTAQTRPRACSVFSAPFSVRGASPALAGDRRGCLQSLHHRGGAGWSPEGPQRGALATRQRMQELKELDLLQRQEKLQRRLVALQEEQRQREQETAQDGASHSEDAVALLNGLSSAPGDPSKASDAEKQSQQLGAAAIRTSGGVGGGRGPDPEPLGGAREFQKKLSYRGGGNAGRRVTVEISSDRFPLQNDALQEKAHDRDFSFGDLLPLPNSFLSGSGEDGQCPPAGDESLQPLSGCGARSRSLEVYGDKENRAPRDNGRHGYTSTQFPCFVDSVDSALPSFLSKPGDPSLFLSSSLGSSGLCASFGNSPVAVSASAGPLRHPVDSDVPRPQQTPDAAACASVFSSLAHSRKTRAPTLLQCEWAAAASLPLSPLPLARPGEACFQVSEASGCAVRRSLSWRQYPVDADERATPADKSQRRTKSVLPASRNSGAVVFELSARAIDETPQSAGAIQQPISYILPSGRSRDICPPHKHLAQQLKLRERKQQERLQRLERQQRREEEARKRTTQASGKTQKAEQGATLRGQSRQPPRTDARGSPSEQTPSPAHAKTLRFSGQGPASKTRGAEARAAPPALSLFVPTTAKASTQKAKGLHSSDIRCSTEPVGPSSRSTDLGGATVRTQPVKVRVRTREGQLAHPYSAGPANAAERESGVNVAEKRAARAALTRVAGDASPQALRRKRDERGGRGGNLSLPSDSAAPSDAVEPRRRECHAPVPSRRADYRSAALVGYEPPREGLRPARGGDPVHSKGSGADPRSAPSSLKTSVAPVKPCSVPLRREGQGELRGRDTLIVCGEGLLGSRRKRDGDSLSCGGRQDTDACEARGHLQYQPEEEDDKKLRRLVRMLRARLLETEEMEAEGHSPESAGGQGRARLRRAEGQAKQPGRKGEHWEGRVGGKEDDEGLGGEARKDPRRDSLAGRQSPRASCPRVTHASLTSRKKGERVRSEQGAERGLFSNRLQDEDASVEDSRSRTSAESDSGWSIVRRLRRILQVEEERRRKGKPDLTARGRGQRTRRRPPSAGRAATSESDTAARVVRHRAAKSETRRSRKRGFRPNKHQSLSPANWGGLSTRRRQQWTESASPSTSGSFSSFRESASLLSSAGPSSASASSLFSPSSLSPGQQAALGNAASLASSTSSASAPSLITKWLHYSATLLQSQALADSKPQSPSAQLESPSCLKSRRRRRQEESETGSTLHPRRNREKSSPICTRRSEDESEEDSRDRAGRRRESLSSSSFPSRSPRLRLGGADVSSARATGTARRSGRKGRSRETKKRYNPLTEDPVDVVRRIKKRLGLPVSSESSRQSSPDRASLVGASPCSDEKRRLQPRKQRLEGQATTLADATDGSGSPWPGRRREPSLRAPDHDSPAFVAASVDTPQPRGAQVSRDARGAEVGLAWSEEESGRVRPPPRAHPAATRAISPEKGEEREGFDAYLKANEDGASHSRAWNPLSSLSLSISSSSRSCSPSKNRVAAASGVTQPAAGCQDRGRGDPRDLVRLSDSGDLRLSLSAEPVLAEQRRGGCKQERAPGAGVEIDVTLVRLQERPPRADARDRRSKTPETREPCESLRLAEQLQTGPNAETAHQAVQRRSSQLLSSFVSEDSHLEEEPGSAARHKPTASSRNTRDSTPVLAGGTHQEAYEPGEVPQPAPRATFKGTPDVEIHADGTFHLSTLRGRDDPQGPLRVSALLRSLSNASEVLAESGGETSGERGSLPTQQTEAGGASSGGRRVFLCAHRATRQLDGGDEAADTRAPLAHVGMHGESEKRPDMPRELRTPDNDVVLAPERPRKQLDAVSHEEEETKSLKHAGINGGASDRRTVSLSPVNSCRGETALSGATSAHKSVADGEGAERHDAEPQSQPSPRSGAYLFSEFPHADDRFEEVRPCEDRELGQTLSAQLADIQQLQSLLEEAAALEGPAPHLPRFVDGGSPAGPTAGKFEGEQTIKNDDGNHVSIDDCPPKSANLERLAQVAACRAQGQALSLKGSAQDAGAVLDDRVTAGSEGREGDILTESAMGSGDQRSRYAEGGPGERSQPAREERAERQNEARRRSEAAPRTESSQHQIERAPGRATCGKRATESQADDLLSLSRSGASLGGMLAALCHGTSEYCEGASDRPASAHAAHVLGCETLAPLAAETAWLSLSPEEGKGLGQEEMIVNQASGINADLPSGSTGSRGLRSKGPKGLPVRESEELDARARPPRADSANLRAAAAHNDQPEKGSRDRVSGAEDGGSLATRHASVDCEETPGAVQATQSRNLVPTRAEDCKDEDSSGKRAEGDEKTEMRPQEGFNNETQTQISPPKSLLPMLTNLLQTQQPLLQRLLEQLQDSKGLPGDSERGDKELPSVSAPLAARASGQGLHKPPTVLDRESKFPSTAHADTCGETRAAQGSGAHAAAGPSENASALPQGVPSLADMQGHSAAASLTAEWSCAVAAPREEGGLPAAQGRRRPAERQEGHQLSAAHSAESARVSGQDRREDYTEAEAVLTQKQQEDRAEAPPRVHPAPAGTAQDEQLMDVPDEGIRENVDRLNTSELEGERRGPEGLFRGKIEDGQLPGGGTLPEEGRPEGQERLQLRDRLRAPKELVELGWLIASFSEIQHTLQNDSTKGPKSARVPETGFTEWEDMLSKQRSLFLEIIARQPLSVLGSLPPPEMTDERKALAQEGDWSCGGSDKPRHSRRSAVAPREAEHSSRGREGCRTSGDVFFGRGRATVGAWLDRRGTESDDSDSVCCLPSTRKDSEEERGLMEVLSLEKRSRSGHRRRRYPMSRGADVHDREETNEHRWLNWGGAEAYLEQRRRLHEIVQRELGSEED
ncbi:hypothetical protein BESB_068360 [Besnoitia besnoiti]|uniref:Uncharacterized protein n=1 Tax=Besnoitia besnoiti TaxID=94643 RepID=A0A2A9MGL8_BESBE|nr:hypothetical protein BESB_068360 [Besnoitia besnoiti]PFH34803.1 hypothetical protein BESB_068360 [Besnoitia besnoiti]